MSDRLEIGTIRCYWSNNNWRSSRERTAVVGSIRPGKAGSASPGRRKGTTEPVLLILGSQNPQVISALQDNICWLSCTLHCSSILYSTTLHCSSKLYSTTLHCSSFYKLYIPPGSQNTIKGRLVRPSSQDPSPGKVGGYCYASQCFIFYLKHIYISVTSKMYARIFKHCASLFLRILCLSPLF